MTHRCLIALSLILTAAPLGQAQEKSVRPGINDSFKSADIKEWVTRFEGESREVYHKRKEIVAACQVKPGQAVADIGAGTGLFTRLFAEDVKSSGTVYAVDITKKFLDYIAESAARQHLANIKTVLGTDASTKLPAASADLAFICDTYHHFEYPRRMMTSIHQALKPGGRVVVVDFIRIPGKSTDWVLNHVRAGQDVVEKEITECGFRKVGEIKDVLKDNYFVIFEKAATGAGRDR
jgi:ubiquinone/menaquinone biosynthesis C-methylase UbiE